MQLEYGIRQLESSAGHHNVVTRFRDSGVRPDFFFFFNLLCLSSFMLK